MSRKEQEPESPTPQNQTVGHPKIQLQRLRQPAERLRNYSTMGNYCPRPIQGCRISG